MEGSFFYRIFTTVIKKNACAAHEYGGECKVETVRCSSGRKDMLMYMQLCPVVVNGGKKICLTRRSPVSGAQQNGLRVDITVVMGATTLL